MEGPVSGSRLAPAASEFRRFGKAIRLASDSLTLRPKRRCCFCSVTSAQPAVGSPSSNTPTSTAETTTSRRTQSRARRSAVPRSLRGARRCRRRQPRDHAIGPGKIRLRSLCPSLKSLTDDIGSNLAASIGGMAARMNSEDESRRRDRAIHTCPVGQYQRCHCGRRPLERQLFVKIVECRFAAGVPLRKSVKPAGGVPAVVPAVAAAALSFVLEIASERSPQRSLYASLSGGVVDHAGSAASELSG